MPKPRARKLFNLMVISNHVQEINSFLDGGVNRIFIDLELIGKSKRQNRSSSWISHHTIEDLVRVRAEFPDVEIIVRTNPIGSWSRAEYELIMHSKPDFIMLPMFSGESQVRFAAELIDGRARFIPLVETVSALKYVANLTERPCGVDELFFGLNDLHLELGLSFMFEVLLKKEFVYAAQNAGQIGPFGFGGIGPLDLGVLRGRDVLAMHAEFGSTCAIVSRSFRHLVDPRSFESEIRAIKEKYSEFVENRMILRQLAEDARENIRVVSQGLKK
jgi:hypothetical protein